MIIEVKNKTDFDAKPAKPIEIFYAGIFLTNTEWGSEVLLLSRKRFE